MSAIARTQVEVGSRRLSLLRGGAGAEPVLFLHGGVPGLSLYCSGAHLWADYLPLTARERQVVAPDLPGFGDSAPADAPYGIEAMARTALDLVRALRLGPCHVVGHDEGGGIAVAMALAAPASLRSITIVASPTAAPSGDSVENLTLANPPTPRWSRATQEWALARMSHDPHHVDAALLDRCMECAGAPAHRDAAAHAPAEIALDLAQSVAKAKGQFYTICRDGAFPVPAQLVWGAKDPMTSVEHARVLYGIIAARQRAAHLHVLNSTGNFPFREDRAAFHHVLAAFHDGLSAA
jgi:2-hydroxy-6-oxonona-2,4-dienedioate hydrolase